MKCLTLKQPWAGLVAAGVKDVENRGWDTKHRGRLLIHAGKGVDDRAWRTPRIRLHAGPLCLASGVILGSVELYAVADGEACQLPWADGSPFAWLLRDPLVFPEPIPWRGALGLYEVPDAVVAGQLAEALPPGAWARWHARHRAPAGGVRVGRDGWAGD